MKDESATENLESVKRRVKKLLALSKSPHEAEAESAMRKANELMTAYKISQKEISDFTSKSVKGTKRVSRWRTILANAVENVYATCHYRTPDGKVIFYGEELDVFMATEMYTYLCKTIDRMAKQNIRKNAKYNYRQSYRKGIADQLWNRMFYLGWNCSWRSPEELDTQKKAVQEFVNTMVKLKTIQPIKKKTEISTAYNRGKIDANCVSLARQMTGSGTRSIEGW